MSGQKSPAAEGLVTSDAVTAGARLRRRVLFVAGIVVAAACIVAGAWLLYTKTTLFTGTSSFQRKDLSVLSPSDAVRAAQDEVSSATTNTQTTQAYMDLGQAYLRNSQNGQAIDAYKQAVTSSDSSSDASGASGSGNTGAKLAALAQLASAYTINGDANQTIATFEQIIAVLKQSDNPDLTAQIPKYQAAIDRLKSDGHI